MTSPAEVALSVLGSDFRVVSDDEDMTALVRELWAPFVVEAAGEPPRELSIRTGEGRWRLDAPPYPPIASTDPWLVASALRNSVSGAAIAAAGPIVPIHGAAVERDGTFLVLAGPPKTGKTTLLLELLDRRWLLVTDDLVPVDPDDLTARPFQKPLSVREPERWRRCARAWDVPGWLPEPVSVGLIPAPALPCSRAEVYRPSLLVFPRFEPGAAPALERLTAAATVAWCGDNLHSREPGEPGLLAAVARLGTTTPGFMIGYGSSDDAVELLEKCLAAT